MVRQHHWLNGHGSEQTPGDSGGQRSLACCSPWGNKPSDVLSDWTTNNCFYFSWESWKPDIDSPGRCLKESMWNPTDPKEKTYRKGHWGSPRKQRARCSCNEDRRQEAPPIHPEQLLSDPLSNTSTEPRTSGIQGKHLMWKSLKQTESSFLEDTDYVWRLKLLTITAFFRKIKVYYSLEKKWRYAKEETCKEQQNHILEENKTKQNIICCFSVTQSHPTLCDPMDCSIPGFPVLHCLPELAQIQVHWVGDAIQPYHPLLSPSPPAFNLSQHQGLF